MKFILGIPKEEDILIDSGFKRIDDYNPNSNFILGILLGLFLTFLFSEILNILLFGGNLEFKVYKRLYLFIILIPMHEFIHILFFPKIHNATVGFMLKKFIFFAHTNDEISKVRFMIITIAPFFFLSIVPFCILLFSFNYYVFYFMLYNTLASGIDLVSFFFILKQPKKAILKLNKNHIYIKKKI